MLSLVSVCPGCSTPGVTPAAQWPGCSMWPSGDHIIIVIIVIIIEMIFRAADTKIEHLGLELSLEEVQHIVENVCSRQTFR